uniref:PNP868R n=1 Tax=African swine fever virus TaxID=10497 RepID=A0A6G7KTY7_ASF
MSSLLQILLLYLQYVFNRYIFYYSKPYMWHLWHKRFLPPSPTASAASKKFTMQTTAGKKFCRRRIFTSKNSLSCFLCFQSLHLWAVWSRWPSSSPFVYLSWTPLFSFGSKIVRPFGYLYFGKYSLPLYSSCWEARSLQNLPPSKRFCLSPQSNKRQKICCRYYTQMSNIFTKYKYSIQESPNPYRRQILYKLQTRCCRLFLRTIYCYQPTTRPLYSLPPIYCLQKSFLHVLRAGSGGLYASFPRCNPCPKRITCNFIRLLVTIYRTKQMELQASPLFRTRKFMWLQTSFTAYVPPALYPLYQPFWTVYLCLQKKNFMGLLSSCMQAIYCRNRGLQQELCLYARALYSYKRLSYKQKCSPLFRYQVQIPTCSSKTLQAFLRKKLARILLLASFYYNLAILIYIQTLLCGSPPGISHYTFWCENVQRVYTYQSTRPKKGFPCIYYLYASPESFLRNYRYIGVQDTRNCSPLHSATKTTFQYSSSHRIFHWHFFITTQIPRHFLLYMEKSLQCVVLREKSITSAGKLYKSGKIRNKILQPAGILAMFSKQPNSHGLSIWIPFPLWSWQRALLECTSPVPKPAYTALKQHLFPLLCKKSSKKYVTNPGLSILEYERGRTYDVTWTQGYGILLGSIWIKLRSRSLFIESFRMLQPDSTSTLPTFMCCIKTSQSLRRKSAKRYTKFTGFPRRELLPLLPTCLFTILCKTRSRWKTWPFCAICFFSRGEWCGLPPCWENGSYNYFMQIQYSSMQYGRHAKTRWSNLLLYVSLQKIYYRKLGKKLESCYPSAMATSTMCILCTRRFYLQYLYITDFPWSKSSPLWTGFQNFKTLLQVCIQFLQKPIQLGQAFLGLFVCAKI